MTIKDHSLRSIHVLSVSSLSKHLSSSHFIGMQFVLIRHKKDPANDIAGSLSVGSDFVTHYAAIFQLLGCLTRKESKKLRSPSPFTSVHGESTAFRNDMMFFRPSIDNTTSHLFYIYPVLGKLNTFDPNFLSNMEISYVPLYLFK